MNWTIYKQIQKLGLSYFELGDEKVKQQVVEMLEGQRESEYPSAEEIRACMLDLQRGMRR